MLVAEIYSVHCCRMNRVVTRIYDQVAQLLWECTRFSRFASVLARSLSLGVIHTHTVTLSESGTFQLCSSKSAHLLVKILQSSRPISNTEDNAVYILLICSSGGAAPLEHEGLKEEPTLSGLRIGVFS